MGNDTPLIFEPLDSDEEDQPIIDYSQFIQNSDPEEEDLVTQPIFLLGLDSQLPQMGTSIDAVQPSRGSTALFSQPSQPSLPVSSTQASRQKKGRPKKSKSRAFTAKSKQSFKCKVNGVTHTVSQKDIDTLDFIGTNLKRIADTAREKGPFGSMRSLKLQLVQVQAILDILEKEFLEDTVPRDLWDEMFQTVYRAFHETQNIVEVCKTEVIETELTRQLSDNFSQGLVLQVDDDDSLIPPTPNVRNTRSSSAIARKPSQKRKAKPPTAKSVRTKDSSVPDIAVSSQQAAKRNRLTDPTPSEINLPEPVNCASNANQNETADRPTNPSGSQEKLEEANQTPDLQNSSTPPIRAPVFEFDSDLQNSLTPPIRAPVFEFDTREQTAPSNAQESPSLLPAQIGQTAMEVDFTEMNPSPDILADETYRVDRTQPEVREFVQPSQAVNNESDILADLQTKSQEQQVGTEEPNIIFETQMFEQSQPEPLLFSQSVNEISYRRNQNLGRVLFSLLPYVRQGVLKPGENNIRMFLSDQVYTASITADGNLESGGDVFTSFGRWIKSILGNYLSNQKVRVRKSFRVEYEDQDLGDLVFNQTLLSASQPVKAAPKRPVKPVGVPSTQIPQAKISDVRPKPSAHPVTLPPTPVPAVPKDTTRPIVKILIHSPEEYYRSCRCEEEMWDRQKPLPKKLLDEVSNW